MRTKVERRDTEASSADKQLASRVPPGGMGRSAAHTASADITQSPMMVAQRQKLQSLFGSTAQLSEVPSAQANQSGLPDTLKAGIENLSGMSMDNVRVHTNSSRPAQLNALAYAQGTDIYVGPGQEQHLPHEAWHVVQQAQGRVRATTQLKDGVPVNDDKTLEREADLMGARAAAAAVPTSQRQAAPGAAMLDKTAARSPVQRVAFKFKESDYDTDSPDAIWELAKKYYDDYDEDAYAELRTKVAEHDANLAAELLDAWEAGSGEGNAEKNEKYDEDDEIDYEEPFSEYAQKLEPNKKQVRAAAKNEVGESKRAGSKGQRDKWYGDFVGNDDAKEWWHRIGKAKNGHKDILDAESARIYFAQYLSSKK